MSRARDIIGNGFLFTPGLNLIKNSADKCWASAADPPFPHIKTLFPLDIVLYINSIASFLSFSK